MAGSVNKVILVGNLGRDPEIRLTQNGSKIANLSLATTESWTDQSGQRQERTEWHRIVIFAPSAERAGLAGVVEQYCKKGSKLYIEGKLQTRKWQGQDGQDRYTTEVVLSGYGGVLQMLDSRAGGGGDYAGGTMDDSAMSEPAPMAVGGDDLDDEIPF